MEFADDDQRAAASDVDRDLVDDGMDALGQHIWRMSWGWVEADGASVPRKIQLRIDGRSFDFAVETNRWLRPPEVGPTLHRARQRRAGGLRTLLIAGRIPSGTGSELRDAGVAYVDLGGNAHLHDDGLYVLIEGQRVETRRQTGALRGTEARLLGVFLRDDDAGETTQQDLAARAGIALGAVGQGRKRLEELRILTRVDKRRWRTTDRERGLRVFADGWGTLIRPKLRPVRYRAADGREGPRAEQVLNTFRPLDRRDAPLIGGEWAAGLLTDTPIGEHATIHLPPGDRRDVVKQLRLVKDPDGPMTLLDRYGSGDAFAWGRGDVGMLVHPLWVWAECMTVTDERVTELAANVRREFLTSPS